MQKKIYITAGVLVAIVVAILATFSASSTTYVIESPRLNLGDRSPAPANPISTHEVDIVAKSREQATLPIETIPTNELSSRPPTTPLKTETVSTPSSIDSEEKSHVIHVEKSGTVLAAMEKFAKLSHFEFKTKDFSGLGTMIEEINGLASDNGYYWILYINGKTADKGASSAEVSPGDTIEWRYEKGY